MFYRNNNRNILTNSEIVEWDIKAANISLIKEYSLLSDKQISKIDVLESKNDRNKAVGNIMRKNLKFGKDLENKFNEVINEFISINNLDKEYDVISIKRDAIFVANRNINFDTIGKNIKFIPKNIYRSYLYIKPYEFYYRLNQKGIIDVKGLSDNLIPLHENGIITFLLDTMRLLENSVQNKDRLNKYLKRFVELYKTYNLDIEYYREFNNESRYKFIINGEILMSDELIHSMGEYLNNEYNYINIILPVIQRVI